MESNETGSKEKFDFVDKFDDMNLLQKTGCVTGGVVGFFVGGTVAMAEYGVRRLFTDDKPVDIEKRTNKTLEVVVESLADLGTHAAPAAFGALISFATGKYLNGSNLKKPS